MRVHFHLCLGFFFFLFSSWSRISRDGTCKSRINSDGLRISSGHGKLSRMLGFHFHSDFVGTTFGQGFSIGAKLTLGLMVCSGAVSSYFSSLALKLSTSHYLVPYSALAELLLHLWVSAILTPSMVVFDFLIFSRQEHNKIRKSTFRTIPWSAILAHRKQKEFFIDS